MVSELNKNEKKYFICDLCKLAYLKKEYAEKCEIWCKNNKGSCNPELVKFAVSLD